MPTRLSTRGISVAGFAGRSRRRTVRSMLPAGLTLPVALLGVATISGCRTDAESTRLPSLNPTRWLAREDASDEQEVADDADLLSVPDDASIAPPLPPTPRRDLFAPAPAPLPEPVSHEDEEFYGVRPTGAEVPGPREPSWSARFRNLFQKRGTSKSSAKAAPSRGVPVSSADAVDHTPVPRRRQPHVRPTAVALGQPEFDSVGIDAASRSVQPVSRVEPAPAPRVRRYEPLPTISPAQTMNAAPTIDTTEPQPWPYPTSEPPTFDAAPSPAPFEPQPLPADASPVPQLMTVPEGPALFR